MIRVETIATDTGKGGVFIADSVAAAKSQLRDIQNTEIKWAKEDGRQPVQVYSSAIAFHHDIRLNFTQADVTRVTKATLKQSLKGE